MIEEFHSIPGFMSLGDERTGNYGIQDQRAALSWVQQHIPSFGGDPRAVTIGWRENKSFNISIPPFSWT